MLKISSGKADIFVIDSKKIGSRGRLKTCLLLPFKNSTEKLKTSNVWTC